MQRILVVGATSSLAEHCLRLWLTEPVEVLLVARSATKLQRLVDDLRVRSAGSSIDSVVIDFFDTSAIETTVQSFAAAGGIDLALIAHGTLPDQQQCQQDLDALVAAQQVNSLSPMLFAEALAGVMAQAGKGCLGIIGSVAGDRGRRSNYVYGAAKASLDRYAQGLQHRLAGSGVDVCLVKPGPTATPMTEHMEGVGPALAPVEDVAAAIVAGMKKAKPVIYAPRRWAFIMLVIRHLPRFVFNRLDI